MTQLVMFDTYHKRGSGMEKDKLKEYKWIKKNIDELEDRLLEIDTQLQRTTADLTGDRVQSSGDKDKWTGLIQKKVELEELINAEITNGLNEMAKIEKAIGLLTEREKRLMRLRYIHCKEWEDICELMNYEIRQVHYIHSTALGRMGVE